MASKDTSRRIPKSGHRYRKTSTKPQNTKEFRDWVAKGKPADDLPKDNRVQTKQAWERAVAAEARRRMKEMDKKGPRRGRSGPSN